MGFNNDDLVNGFVKGDEKVIVYLYSKNLPIITNYIQKNSGSKSDAEDIFQDALVITYQKLKENDLNLNCSLATYIYAVSRNLWMNTLRKRKKLLLTNELFDISETTEQSIIETINNYQRHSIYQKHFLKLGQICQEVLISFFKGKSMVEIANMMNYSEGYARKKKFECKKKLLEMIKKDPLYKGL